MRERLNAIFAAIVLAIMGTVTVTVTGAWCYYIWSFNWGHFGTRGWGLWAMVMMFGAIIIFTVLVSVFFWLLDEGWRR